MKLMPIFEKLYLLILALVGVIFFGIFGYEIIEGWDMFDSLYMTVITLASVGYGEVHPLSHAGRTFTMFLILGGTGVLVYGVSTITAFVVEGELTDALRRRKMQKKIDMIRDHYIVCGADHTGRYVIDELVKTGKEFVVIERDQERLRSLENLKVPFVEGDATQNAVLQSAGIHRAKGLLACLHSDAENLFIVFTAKKLNPALRVISKAMEEESEQKIRMAGADGVVMPYSIGGLRMASEMLRPSVVTFLDMMLRAKDKTIRVDEIMLGADSTFVGKKLSETGIRELKEATVVALIDRKTGKYSFNTSEDTMLTSEHVLIVMGNVTEINKIREMAL